MKGGAEFGLNRSPQNNVERQIERAVDWHAGDDVQGAAFMLSGMSLVATYLAKQEGSKEYTPQVVLNAIHQVARLRGMEVGKIKKGNI